MYLNLSQICLEKKHNLIVDIKNNDIQVILIFSEDNGETKNTQFLTATTVFYNNVLSYTNNKIIQYEKGKQSLWWSSDGSLCRFPFPYRGGVIHETMKLLR